MLPIGSSSLTGCIARDTSGVKRICSKPASRRPEARLYGPLTLRLSAASRAYETLSSHSVWHVLVENSTSLAVLGTVHGGEAYEIPTHEGPITARFASRLTALKRM